MNRPVLAVAFLLVLPALAQQSASYKISDHALNAGGEPPGGAVLASATYRLTLAALGDAVSASLLAGPSYRMDLEIVSRYIPPAEVRGLVFVGEETMTWVPDPCGGDYNLYRGDLGDILGSGYGECSRQGIPTTTASILEIPLSGEGTFYLLTAENRVGEEGTKGRDSAGLERLGTVCP